MRLLILSVLGSSLPALATDPAACRMDFDCPGDLVCNHFVCGPPSRSRAVPRPETLTVPLAHLVTEPPPRPVPAPAPLVPEPPPPLVDAPIPVPLPPPAPAGPGAPPTLSPSDVEGARVAAAEPPPKTEDPLDSWAPPPAQPEAPPAAAATATAAGYKGVAWDTAAGAFKASKGIASGAVSREPLTADPLWSDALAAMLGTPADLRQAAPARFASAFVAADDTHYLFYEGRLVGAVVEVSALNESALKVALHKRYKPKGPAIARSLAARDSHPAASLAADLFVNGPTRVYLARLQHPASAAGGDLVSSLRLVYFSDAGFERITRAIQRAAAELRRGQTAPVKDPVAADLGKIE